MPKYRIILKLMPIRNGKYIRDKDVITRKVKVISVNCTATMEIDGETDEAKSFSVEVRHKVLKIFDLPGKP
jgi:diacylglycerol kinase family enzyme